MTTRPNLALGALFQEAWDAFRKAPVLMLGTSFVYLLIMALLSPEMDGRNAWVLNLIRLVVHGPLVGGLVLVGWKVLHRQPARFGDLFAGFRRFATLFGVGALFSLGTALGMMLLVVPGVIFAVGFSPVYLVAMRTGLGVVDSFKEAWGLTRGRRWQLTLIGLALVVVNALGVVALVVGVVLTGAVSILVYAIVYRELQRGSAVHPPAESFEI